MGGLQIGTTGLRRWAMKHHIYKKQRSLLYNTCYIKKGGGCQNKRALR